MREAPSDLGPEQVAQALHEYWEIHAADVTYSPLGLGSHNWTVVDVTGGKWFVKANRAGGESGFFHAACRTALALREAGLEFVNAAVRDTSGDPRPATSSGWELTVFPFLDGRNPDWTTTGERSQIAEMIGRLHAGGVIPDGCPRWTPRWRQDELRRLLDERLDEPWTGGPYGESARSLVREDVAGIRRLLDHSDRLVDRLLDDPEPRVMTHGEPNAGNTMVDTTGSTYLIDCDVMMTAPRERDLWELLTVGDGGTPDIDPDLLAAYRRTAGPIDVRPYVLDLFRVERHLAEISGCACTFADDHRDDENVAVDWRSLRRHLPVARTRPDIG